MKLVKTLSSFLLICLVINANPVTPPDFDSGKGPVENGVSPVQKPVLKLHSAAEKWVGIPEAEVEIGGRKVITDKEVEFGGGSNQEASLPVKPGMTKNVLSGVAKKSLNGLQSIASKTID